VDCVIFDVLKSTIFSSLWISQPPQNKIKKLPICRHCCAHLFSGLLSGPTCVFQSGHKTRVQVAIGQLRSVALRHFLFAGVWYTSWHMLNIFRYFSSSEPWCHGYLRRFSFLEVSIFSPQGASTSVPKLMAAFGGFFSVVLSDVQFCRLYVLLFCTFCRTYSFVERTVLSNVPFSHVLLFLHLLCFRAVRRAPCCTTCIFVAQLSHAVRLCPDRSTVYIPTHTNVWFDSWVERTSQRPGHMNSEDTFRLAACASISIVARFWGSNVLQEPRLCR